MLGLDGVQRAACIAAHPDDEVLGAGATLSLLADRGCETHVLVLGEGVGARFPEGQRPAADVRQLGQELRAAATILGATPHQRDLPDNRFDALDLLDVVQHVEAFKHEVQPQLIFTHHPGDLNVDHGVTFRAVLTAFRPLPGEPAAALAAYETLSSTEWSVAATRFAFEPNWFVDAGPGLERKLAAMAEYRGELRDWPHPRSLEGIRVAARRWGMTVGLDAAEPFQLVRALIR
jgi:LmbE family N-acetylglucosaminyl deacetylase